MNLNRAIELLRIGSGNQQATFNFSVSKGWGQLY